MGQSIPLMINEKLMLALSDLVDEYRSFNSSIVFLEVLYAPGGIPIGKK
jgi:hypothetical protein